MTQDKHSQPWRSRIDQLPSERLAPLDRERASSLIEAALQARAAGYAPYSKFTVGAAALGSDGTIYAGCNVENASYGATMCAERNAIFSAIAHGCKEILALAVIADYPRPIPPCGICRQVLAEFTQKAPVLMVNLAGDVEIRSAAELLPLAFDLSVSKQ